MIRTRSIALCSLLFTTIFFLEYTPLLHRVHVPYDLDSYHYPLADYAFQAIRHGRIPQWDPTIYSGMSFVGNVQAALFYPPQWLMFALNMGSEKLPYQALECLVFAHVWLAFMLCFLWLQRGQRLHWLACTLGAGVFAFSGLMMLQLQHLGLIAAYSWMPLGFWGIDEAAETRRFRPLWKLVLAFMMCILAGYPTMWVVFAVSMFAYSTARARPFRLTAGVGAAMAFSAVLCAVQLLPAFEAMHGKTLDVKYGATSGIKSPAFFISYVAPNYYDFGLNTDIHKNLGQEYLYVGAAAIAGLTLLLLNKRKMLPAAAVLLASFVFLTNPFGLAGKAIEGTFLAEVFSGWYFLAGISAALALLAALGLDAGLRRGGKPWPWWAASGGIALTLAWAARLAVLWMRQALPVLWLSGIDALIGALLCAALIAIFARSKGTMATVSAATLILLSAVEYKAFGTSKRFNAASGPFDADYAVPFYPGMNDQTFKTLLEHAEFRMAADVYGPDPGKLRHAGLSSPQGFDPFLTARYHTLVEQLGHFTSNRVFNLDPDNMDGLHLLGVRYFGTVEGAPLYKRLLVDPRYRLMLPADSYYKIFEVTGAEPSFGWERHDPGQTAEKIAWKPERRAIHVRSLGGTFRMSEQSSPGWRAFIDGSETPIARCHEAFQCITLVGGQHLVEFRYRSQWLRSGFFVSLASLIGGMLWLWITRPRIERLNRPFIRR